MAHPYYGLVELLTGAEFLHYTGLLKLTLELLQCLFDALIFLYRYYNHCTLFRWLIINVI